MANLFWCLNVTLLLMFSAAGYFCCRWVFIRHGPIEPDQLLHKCRHLYALLPVPVLLLLAHFYLNGRYDRQWELPYWIQLYYGPITWGLLEALLAYVFSLSVTSFWIARHPKRWRLFAASILLVATIPFFAWRYHVRTTAIPETEHVTADDVILQSHDATCVAAAAANVANLLGIPMTEGEMVGLCGTTEDGTSPAQLIAAMRRLGIQSSKITVPDANFRLVQPPAIFFVDNDEHAVVFVGTHNGRAEIWDPSDGRKFFSDRKLRLFWTGRALEFHRQERIYVRPAVPDDGRPWFSQHEDEGAGDGGRI